MTSSTAFDAPLTGGRALLIVEDEPMIARILEHKLRREGWAVRTCDSTAAAELVLRDGPVEVALVDATLERDGLAWAGALAESGMLPRGAWLALIEARDPAASGRALGHGAAGVVVKPFKPTAVAAEVRRVAAGRSDP